MKTRPKVAVLMGGYSAEREISLMTGKQIYEALIEQGYPAVEIDLDAKVVEKLTQARPEVVFIALHGRGGEDGAVQGLLEVLGIPYTGSGVLASALGMNKVVAKKIFEVENIPTANFRVVTGKEIKEDFHSLARELEQKIGYPLVIKPPQEGSTIGLSIISRKEGLEEALKKALKYDKSILVEKFVSGVEITVGILGNSNPIALPTLEIVSETDFYDYEAKYTPGMSHHIIPARISESQRKQAQEIALKAHKALGCRGLSRVDLIVDEESAPYVLEVNTIPGMTKLSLFPDAARAAGIEFPDLIARIVDLALENTS